MVSSFFVSLCLYVSMTLSFDDDDGDDAYDKDNDDGDDDSIARRCPPVGTEVIDGLMKWVGG